MSFRGLLIPALLAMLAVPAFAEESVLEGLEREIRSLVDTAGPAVVKVTAETDEPERPRLPVELPFLLKSSRVGTGFLVSSEGFVLTSHRVAKGAKKARVEFAGGATREGIVLGSDDFFQLAVVKVEPVPGVEPLALSTAGAPAPGSLGILLGNALGESRNISLGIVTARERSGRPFHPFDNYLAVNAPVQPGDAGGPFLDRKGRVVGMAVGPHSSGFGFVMRGSSRGGIQGLPGTSGPAWIVPAADLKFAFDEIREHGRVRRGALGVVMKTRGLELRAVRPDSPAAEAGLAPGDVFVEVAGEKVEDARRFSRILRRTPVDVPLPLTVLRGGEKLSLTARLEEVTPEREPLVAGIAAVRINGRVVLASVRGRLVDAGVRSGDTVIAIDGEEIRDPDAVVKILLGARKGGDPIRLTLERRGEPIEVVVAD